MVRLHQPEIETDGLAQRAKDGVLLGFVEGELVKAVYEIRPVMRQASWRRRRRQIPLLWKAGSSRAGGRIGVALVRRQGGPAAST